MDSTLELLHGYNFSKLVGYRLLFSFSFLSFFSFHYLFLPKLVRPSILGSWIFTPWSFNSVFLHVFPLFPLFSSFSKGIYRVLLKFLMDSNIDRSKLSPLIKMRGFWINVNSWNLCPSMVLGWWFCNKFA